MNTLAGKGNVGHKLGIVICYNYNMMMMIVYKLKEGEVGLCPDE